LLFGFYSCLPFFEFSPHKGTPLMVGKVSPHFLVSFFFFWGNFFFFFFFFWSVVSGACSFPPPEQTNPPPLPRFPGPVFCFSLDFSPPGGAKAKRQPPGPLVGPLFPFFPYPLFLQPSEQCTQALKGPRGTKPTVILLTSPPPVCWFFLRGGVKSAFVSTLKVLNKTTTFLFSCFSFFFFLGLGWFSPFLSPPPKGAFPPCVIFFPLPGLAEKRNDHPPPVLFLWGRPTGGFKSFPPPSFWWVFGPFVQPSFPTKFLFFLVFHQFPVEPPSLGCPRVGGTLGYPKTVVPFFTIFFFRSLLPKNSKLLGLGLFFFFSVLYPFLLFWFFSHVCFFFFFFVINPFYVFRKCLNTHTGPHHPVWGCFGPGFFFFVGFYGHQSVWGQPLPRVGATCPFLCFFFFCLRAGLSFALWGGLVGLVPRDQYGVHLGTPPPPGTFFFGAKQKTKPKPKTPPPPKKNKKGGGVVCFPFSSFDCFSFLPNALFGCWTGGGFSEFFFFCPFFLMGVSFGSGGIPQNPTLSLGFPKFCPNLRGVRCGFGFPQPPCAFSVVFLSFPELNPPGSGFPPLPPQTPVFCGSFGGEKVVGLLFLEPYQVSCPCPFFSFRLSTSLIFFFVVLFRKGLWGFCFPHGSLVVFFFFFLPDSQEWVFFFFFGPPPLVPQTWFLVHPFSVFGGVVWFAPGCRGTSTPQTKTPNLGLVVCSLFGPFHFFLDFFV